MKKKMQIDFDDYVHTYEKTLIDQLGFFVKKRDYYSEYKVELATRFVVDPLKVLDFGCGIGLSLPFIKKYFPKSAIFASDTSRQSLDYVANTYPEVSVIHDDEIGIQKYDFIFIAGVFHHIELEDRDLVFQRLQRCLENNGRMIIFEHNPYNPLTQKLVSNCEFDADANLVSKGKMYKYIESTPGLRVLSSGYTLFFPESLKKLHGLENFIRWLPLGGQYFVLVGKKSLPEDD